MRLLWASVLLASAGIPLTGSQVTPVAMNVNTRYTIEAVELVGNGEFKLSRGLKAAISDLTGARLDFSLLGELAERLRTELHARVVTHRIQRGTIPDHVKVVFEITRRMVELNVSVPRFLYHSRQGWTGQAEASVTMGTHQASFGVVSDNDEVVERSTGIYGRFEKRRLGSNRLRGRFLYEGYRARWNPTTLTAMEAGDPSTRYRTRQNFEPELSFALTRNVALALSASFQLLEPQQATGHNESVNAIKTGVRYHRLWEDSGTGRVSLDAAYSLHAANAAFSSDYEYTRHRADLQIAFTEGRHHGLFRLQAGTISGLAPYYERFVAGNSSTLRGWNRFDIAAAGASRMVVQSLEYRYGWVFGFYDAGAVWNRGGRAPVRHSLGGGLRRDNLFLALAFPLRDGKMDPVLMAGMNF
ncbi:MAG: BamA/TamA family outer membrane protein [Bryobacteraceae bacterium]